MKFLKDKIYFFLITIFAFSGIFGLSQFVFSENVDVIMNLPAICGNGEVEGDEACDDGDSNDACPASCSTSCTVNSCSSCFLSGTKVLLADGGEKNIEEVEVGDLVLGYNEGLEINQSSKVLQTFVHQNQDYLLINDFLKVTDEHPIFINEKWEEAGSAKIGDRMKDYLGDDILVSSIKELSKNSLVYNLEVENTHTYYADGFLVHNKGECTDNTGPTITITSTTITQNTAYIEASANEGIASANFQYKLQSAETYGDQIGMDSLGSNVYKIDLTSLDSGTTYDYIIIMVDSSCGDNSSSKTESFKTEEGGSSVSLVITNPEADPGITTSSITWSTNKNADRIVDYGFDSEYGSKHEDVDTQNYDTEHSVLLIDLIPSTTYHYQITSFDGTDTVITEDATFKTWSDSNPPPAVEDISVDIDNASLVVTWINPSVSDYPDFLGVKVIRKVDDFSSDIDDGVEVYDGDGQTYTDVVPDDIAFAVEYYYTIFSYDTSLNYSSRVYGHNNVPNYQCNDGEDNDGDGLTDYGTGELNDPGCESLEDDDEYNEDWKGCGNSILEEELGEECDDGDQNGKECEAECSMGCLINDCLTQCNDEEDNDGDGKIDFGEDLACTSELDNTEAGRCGDGITETYLGEECDDGDSNGLRCKAICSAGCLINDNTGCSSGGGDPQCNDGEDNDGDGLIDYGTEESNDPGCSSLDDNLEYNPAGGDMPVVNFDDLLFKAGNRQISLIPKDNTVTSLVGKFFNILISADDVNGDPDSLTLRLNDVINIFTFDEEDNLYYLGIVFPAVGLNEAYIEGVYKEENENQISLASVLVNLDSLPDGKIITKDDVPVVGVKVTLFKDGEKFETSIYGQPNPFNTDEQGEYGWVMPNGNYSLEIEKERFYKRKTQIFVVSNNVINNNLSLIIKLEKIIDVIDPEASIQENIVNVAKNITEKTKVVVERTVQVFKETVDNPLVEATAKKVIAPSAIGTVVVTTLPSIWFNLLNLLRFLFLQPLLLLGRRKRKKWGQVYNSLNKLPVDLVTVRLLDIATNRVVQSRVTDKNGRFIFSVKQGRYKLVAHKHGLVFPSALLGEIKEDGIRIDIYHGEEIVVDEGGTFITPNIPLDPEDQKVKPLLKIRLAKFGRRLQVAFSWLGLIVTVIALYISPVWYMWALLVSHLFIFFVFRRLAMPGKPKGWGVVYDESGKKPLGKTIARLFDSKFNKLISTQVTDKKGRYTFLAGDNKYYVTFEHNKYDLKNTSEINLQGKEEGVVAVDINLEKKK